MMWKSPHLILSIATFLGSQLGVCSDIPGSTISTTLSPSPSPTVIPWETKIDAFREYILQQPDQNATKGFWSGPGIQKTFADGQCLQVRFYNWDCNYDILYKMRGVVKWLDDIDVRNNSGAISDPYRSYTYGHYVDPDSGWTFYGESRLSFGACGNRGPQSSCGVGWCVDKDGKQVSKIPEGQTPYVDPNNRDNVCPWLRGDGAAIHEA
ncbi:hypothetical protein GQ44DRAFT_750495 [Phaeosphaeriaceae sp. PMI808]|nr:hypothetical protein GQ44DRAFT_750495 [Phaeosphaeriaceae sp. PMI808]